MDVSLLDFMQAPTCFSTAMVPSSNPSRLPWQIPLHLKLESTFVSILVLLMTSTTAESLSIELPQGSATVSIPITVTWSRAKTDPTAFGLMEKDINNNVIDSVTPVQAGSASTGVAELTFPNTGQFVIQGITQQFLSVGEQPDSLGGGPQIGVIGDNIVKNFTSPTSTSSSSTSSGSTSSSSTSISTITLTSTLHSSFSASKQTKTSSSSSASTSNPQSGTSSSSVSSNSTRPSSTIPASSASSSRSSSTATAPATSSPTSSASSSHNPVGLSHTAKKAIVLAVIGIVFILAAILVTYLRRRRFIKLRNRIAAFRERLAQIPGLSGFGEATLSSQGSGSSSTSFIGERTAEDGSTPRTTMSETRWRSYPFSESSLTRSSQMFF